MRYSPSENAFYPDGVEYPFEPGDLRSISDELYRQLLAGQEGVFEIASGEDGEPAALPPAAKVPLQCTPAQGLVALFALKQITEDHVLEAIAQIPDPVQQYTARIGYQHATAWERNSATMQTLAQLLQLSDQDLDELFTYAVTVQV